MRPTLAVAGLALALVACGRREEAAPPSPSPSRPAVVAPAASTAPAGGSSLTASVSSLSADILPFQVQETDLAFTVELAADVLFDFDSDRLSAAAPEQLRKTADLIARGGAGAVTVIGHTDAKGTDAYNDDLSLRRARAVAAWLSTEGGAPAGRLKSEGRGEREPVAPNQTASGADDPQGRARNRRVTVVIPKA